MQTPAKIKIVKWLNGRHLNKKIKIWHGKLSNDI